ncbi:MAG: TRAP transporter substrate-binding protein DctP [Chitinispirillales bacterium]|jgi:TRAP-type C4-dicarboxylate transport system substrate-binding protein|nr:TRAP transporter substrate-binding protein DctP [Chitinispirillales bacterium]
MKKFTFVFLVSAMFFCASAITIKLGSLAPQNSPWDDALRDMAAQWQKASSGAVQVKMYAGGIAGDEADMIRKVKIKQLDMVAMTGVGMADVFKGILTVQIPMMYDNEDEFWYILEKMKPYLEKKVEGNGFKVLLWSKIGWVNFFSKQPIVNPADLQKQKIFIYAGDPDAVKVWKTMGFQPVPLSTNDIMTSLQSGMIDAVTISPLTAAAYQWFGAAPNMCNMKWAPLLGGVVVSLESWNKIPADMRKKLEDIAIKVGEKMQADIDKADDEALQIMQTYGLKVSEVPQNVRGQWKTIAEKGVKAVIGTTIEPQSYEQVKKYLEEYRAGNK